MADVDLTATDFTAIAVTGLQTMTVSGAVDVNVGNVYLDTTGGAIAASLADAKEGQEIPLLMTVDGGTDATLTPANYANGTTATFADVDDLLKLRFMSGEWHTVFNNGVVVA